MLSEFLHDELMDVSSESSDLDAECVESEDEYESDAIDDIICNFLKPNV